MRGAIWTRWMRTKRWWKTSLRHRRQGARASPCRPMHTNSPQRDLKHMAVIPSRPHRRFSPPRIHFTLRRCRPCKTPNIGPTPPSPRQGGRLSTPRSSSILMLSPASVLRRVLHAPPPNIPTLLFNRTIPPPLFPITVQFPCIPHSPHSAPHIAWASFPAPSL